MVMFYDYITERLILSVEVTLHLKLAKQDEAKLGGRGSFLNFAKVVSETVFKYRSL